MARIRTTSRTLQAAPNHSSGHNPNTPVQLYDTHPNARFAMGDEVMLMDQLANDVSVIGHVLGHVAEDRLLVQWPHMVTQEDTDDVIAVSETAWGRSGGSSKKTAGRIALFENINPWSQKNKDQRLKKQIIKNNGGMEHEAAMKFNLFQDPQVVTFLKRYGLSDREIKNYASLRQNQLDYMRQKYDQSNQAIGQGDWSQLGKGTPSFGGGSGRRFVVQPRQNPAQPGVVPPAPIVRSSSIQASKLHKAANLADGFLNAPSTAAKIRILAKMVPYTNSQGEAGRTALKSLSRLAMVIADEIRDQESKTSEKVAELVEEGVVEATPLGA